MSLPKLEVGYGLGKGRDSFSTGAKSATQAMTGIKQCPLAAVLVFASVKYDLEAVLQGIFSVVGDVPLIGSTTAGEICNGPQQESVVVVALASPYLKVRVGLGEGVSQNWRQAVSQAVSSPEIEPFFSPHSLIWQELALQGKSAFALLFSPGNTRTADSPSFEILEELTRLSRGLLPIMGGGSADDWKMEANYSLWGQRAYADSVLVAVFETELRFGIAMAHGYHPSSRRGTVTHSHDHEVLEIMGESAAEAYCRMHNSSREALEGKHLTFTTKRPMGMPDPYGQYRLNVASYFTAEGGVRFAQPTPEGTILTVMEANPDSQVAAGADALRKALLRGAITDPGMALVFSCAVRRRVLGKRIGEEIDGIKDLIPGVPVLGFYSFGEQGQSDHGVNRHNNAVIAVLTLGRCLSFGAQVALENEQLRLNLEQSRNLLQLIIESIPVRVFWKDLDSRYLGCNTLFARDSGLSSPEQLLGQDDFTMGWEEQAKLYRADDRQVMDSGRPKMNIIEPQTTPDGGKIWLNTSKVPLLKPNGEVFGVLGVYEDITKRKQAEEALRQAHETLRATLDAAPVAIFDLDIEGRVKNLWNPAAEKMMGWRRDEVLGQILPSVPEEGQEEFADSLNFIQSGRTIFGKDVVRRRKDGSRIEYSIYGAPEYDDEGKVIGNIAVLMDITERKQAEEALEEQLNFLQTLIDTIPNPIFYKDISGKYSGCNLAFEKYIGLSKQDIIGKTVFDMAPSELATKYNEMDQALFRQPGEQVYESAVRYADGSLHQVIFNKATFFKTNGTVGGLVGVMLDITERKRNEEQLLQAQEEWERTFNTIPALIMILDNQHRIVKANQAMAQAFGYSPEGMVGKLCHQVVHGSEVPPAFCPHSKLLSHGYAEPQEVWLEEIQSHLHVSVTPLYDGSGRIMGSVHVANDITERKLAEVALRKSEEKYRLLVGQIPAVVFKGYEDWSIECFDDKIQTLTGYSKEDFNSRRVLWRDLIPEEEMPYVKRVFQEALKGNRSYFREHRIRKKDGTYAWVQCRGQIFCNEQGGVEYVSGVTFDITAQKQAEAALRESEERYRLIAENVSDVLWTADMDLHLTYISPSIQSMLGFAPEEMVGKNAGELLPPSSMVQALEVLSEELAREKTESIDPNRSRVLELDEVHKNESLVRTEVKVSFIRDSALQPIGILGVTRDITKRKQVEESLRRRDAFLEAVSLAAERFLRTDFWDANPTDILGQLGRAMEVSRVYIFENHLGEDGTLLTSQRFEWVAQGIASEWDNPDNQNFPYHTGGMGRFADLMARGKIVHGNIKDFPAEEQAILVPQGIKSIIIMPIFVEDYWWGFIGFDDCLREREWAAVEIEAIKTAANMLGAAILQSQSEKALRESEKKLRSLSYQLLDVQENERNRLAIELHDVLGHDLLNLKLRLESLRDELLPEQAHFKEEMARIISTLQNSVKDVRLLYQDLIPADLEELGLTKSLGNLLEEFALTKRIIWQAHLDSTIDTLFDLALETNIYRLVQEGLTNIGKHAEATHVFLGAEKDKEKVTLILEDNGIGFNVSEVRARKRTMGLLSMEKRLEPWGGSFGIQSKPKQGTRICATIPILKRK